MQGSMRLGRQRTAAIRMHQRAPVFPHGRSLKASRLEPNPSVRALARVLSYTEHDYEHALINPGNMKKTMRVFSHSRTQPVKANLHGDRIYTPRGRHFGERWTPT